MKINSVNRSQSNQNFKGAYILKGNAKALARVREEISLQTFINPKFPDVFTYPLTANYSKTQPYGEILFCTGRHIENVERFLLIQKQEQAARIRKFANDFNSWSDKKKAQWREGIDRAVNRIKDGEVVEAAPGERELENGNADTFLNWYSDTIKESNNTYERMSRCGALPFPAKIRRLDADKVADALVCNNFNLKEGFFRNAKAPKVEIEEEQNCMMRYIDGKLDSVMSYRHRLFPGLSGETKVLEQYTKLIYDSKGKFVKTKTEDFRNPLGR